MNDRLPSRLVVTALLRRVNDAGGMAMVLNRGDAQSGAILVLTLERGQDPHFYERGLGPQGQPTLVETGPKTNDFSTIEAYWRKRCHNDPDLWVVELDIAEAQRFAAETIMGC